MDSADLFAPVSQPEEQGQPRFAGLGRLEEVGAWLSACQGVFPPQRISAPRLVVFAGDHGIAVRGVDPRGAGTSLAEVEQLRQGTHPAVTLADAVSAAVRVVDVSLDHEAWGEERVTAGSGLIDLADAMSREDLHRALEIGRRIADSAVDSGADLLIPASSGMAAEITAMALCGALTRTEPVVVVGPGYGVAVSLWQEQVKVVRDAMFRVRHDITDPLLVLQRISSPEIAALVAFCAQAAVRRTPVLIDGTVVTVAAMIADRLAPGARAWFRAGQVGGSPAHLAAQRDLGLTPLLDLDLDPAAGAAGLNVLPLFNNAAGLLQSLAGEETEPR